MLSKNVRASPTKPIVDFIVVQQFTGIKEINIIVFAITVFVTNVIDSMAII